MCESRIYFQPVDFADDDVSPVDEGDLLTLAEVHRVVRLDVYKVTVPHFLCSHRDVL